VIGELDAGTRIGPDPDGRSRGRIPGFSSVGGRWWARRSLRMTVEEGGDRERPRPTRPEAG
jgi:hypothetical protein